MVGLLITIVFALAVSWLGSLWIAKMNPDSDPSERFGLGGILGLGVFGLFTLQIVLQKIPYATGLIVFAALSIGLTVWFCRPQIIGYPWKVKSQKGALPFLLGIFVLLIFPLFGVLAPSTAIDWDSLAYHLAVPKILLTDPSPYVRGIHHSNFPFTADNLYIYGLLWGGQSGAKAFSMAFLILGCIWIFGLVRRWGGGTRSYWAPLALAASPVILWEAGTAYIDHIHALFAAIAVLFSWELLDRIGKGQSTLDTSLIAGLGLGFCIGTKYTGLQVAICLLLVILIAGRGLVTKLWKPVVIAGVLTLVVGGPWYIKNIVTVGNPVYPFFYSVFGGDDWDDWRAQTYSNEQKSFGVGSDLSKIGHAVLGLAYQPGRYVNPAQQSGGGFPTGAVGLATIAVAFGIAISGGLRSRDKFVLGWMGLILVLWFLLSQQSRYLAILVVPIAAIFPLCMDRLVLGRALAGTIAVQAILTIWMLSKFQLPGQKDVVLGVISTEDYQTEVVPFYAAAQDINLRDDVKKIALYDMVFGYFLDKPYFWANPGHSKILLYQEMASGDDLANQLIKTGTSHVFLYTGLTPPAERDKFLGTAGLLDVPGYSAEEQTAMKENLDLKWRLLLAEAISAGRMQVIEVYDRGMLLEVKKAN